MLNSDKCTENRYPRERKKLETCKCVKAENTGGSGVPSLNERSGLDIKRNFFTQTAVQHAIGCPGECLGHHHWRSARNVWMQNLVAWFSGGLVSTRLRVGLDNLKRSFPN